MFSVSVLTGIFPLASYNDTFLLPSSFFLLLPPFTTHNWIVYVLSKPHPVVVAACHFSVRFRKPNAYVKEKRRIYPLSVVSLSATLCKLCVVRVVCGVSCVCYTYCCWHVLMQIFLSFPPSPPFYPRYYTFDCLFCARRQPVKRSVAKFIQSLDHKRQHEKKLHINHDSHYTDARLLVKCLECHRVSRFAPFLFTLPPTLDTMLAGPPIPGSALYSGPVNHSLSSKVNGFIYIIMLII